MKLKFCGLTREEDIEAANEIRPDYVGFVFADSRRKVSDRDAARLREHLDPDIKTVGVFVNDDPKHIAALVRDEVIDLVQLHGGESVRYIEKLREMIDAPIIYAVRVESRRERGEEERNFRNLHKMPVFLLYVSVSAAYAKPKIMRASSLIMSLFHGGSQTMLTFASDTDGNASMRQRKSSAIAGPIEQPGAVSVMSASTRRLPPPSSKTSSL